MKPGPAGRIKHWVVGKTRSELREALELGRRGTSGRNGSYLTPSGLKLDEPPSSHPRCKHRCFGSKTALSIDVINVTDDKRRTLNQVCGCSVDLD